jgi:raffinose/stachyose/melibiose transport system substrate-binding protein
MKASKIINLTGVSLLAVCLIISAKRILTRSIEEADPNKRVIRIAHAQLETGVRAAFDLLAREYEMLHPDTVVKQIAVPERVYKSWIVTQLIGGTAPQIIELGSGGANVNAELLSQYFTSLSEYLRRPNPYNEGTALGDTVWQQTFIDGLSSGPAYNNSLGDHYGVNMSMNTVRLYVNARLLEAITGRRDFPKDFDGFIRLCEAVNLYAKERGIGMVAIAGSSVNAPQILNGLANSQIQGLTLELNPIHDLALDNNELGLYFLLNRWSLRDRAPQRAFELMRAVGRHMQSGFSELRRDDASFIFLQERALTIPASSSEAKTFRSQVPFEVLVVDIPLPGKDDPVYGEAIIGRPSDATSTRVTFGLVTGSKAPGASLDFLQFITSKRANETFSRASSWLPSIVTVEPDPDMRPFIPRLGDSPFSGTALNFGRSANAHQAFSVNLYRLVSETGSTEDFTSAFEASLPSALKQDLQRLIPYVKGSFVRQDALITGYRRLLSTRPEEETWATRLSLVIDSETRIEDKVSWWIYLNNVVEEAN